MELAAIDGIELEYELRGSGEPVLLIHGALARVGPSPCSRNPLLPSATGCCVTAALGSEAAARSRADQRGRSRRALPASALRRLGIERAHVVGHSSSALIALQLALDAPDTVQSLALMDAARPAPATELQAAFLREVAASAIGRIARRCRRRGHIWARGVFGPGYRVPLDRGMPGLFEESSAARTHFSARSCPPSRGGRSPRPMRTGSHSPS